MPRDFMITKKSKTGPVKQILPNFAKGSSYYTLAFDPDFDNIKYLELVSKFQLYVDQSISTNTYYSPADFNEEGVLPMKKITSTLKAAHKLGLKTLYYTNFDDQDIAKNSNGDDSCEGGACSV
jgi:ribonucleoside-diphosphate reductase alpha chain